MKISIVAAGPGGRDGMTLESLRAVEEQLPDGEFIRIHRSFVVPEKRIAKFSSTEVVLSKCGKRLPVGKTYSEAAMAVLSREK